MIRDEIARMVEEAVDRAKSDELPFEERSA